jgi:3-oxoadipate enol-lactonase
MTPFIPHHVIEGVGPPLVLIHGVGGALDSWDAIVERLKPHFRLIRYDLRGHGASAKLPGPYTLQDFVDDHVALLDHLGLASADVAGFSLGGLIAQALALAHPARVGRLALISAIGARTAEESAKARARADALVAGGAEGHLDAAVDRWFTKAFQTAHPEIIEKRKRASRANDPHCYAAAYRVLADSDLIDDLHRIPHRTLVMTGELDAGSTPRMSKAMTERLPHAQFILLPGLKHSVLLEAPATVAGRLLDFLKETDR